MMGEPYKCKGCGRTDGKYKIYWNVYSKGILLQPHLEIVCEFCNYGSCIIFEKGKSKLNFGGQYE